MQVVLYNGCKMVVVVVVVDIGSKLFLLLIGSSVTCQWHRTSTTSRAVSPRSEIRRHSSRQHLSAGSSVQPESRRSTGGVHQRPSSLSSLPEVMLLLHGQLPGITHGVYRLLEILENLWNTKTRI